MGIAQEPPAAASGNEPPSYSDCRESHDPVANRGRSGNLLSSSANRGWSGRSAELRGEMAGAIASELQAETSGGRLLVESLANSVAARLLQKHIGVPAAQSRTFLTREGLDRRRLLRVLDYIEANLEGDLTIDRM